MAYREPASIYWSRVPEEWEYPRLRDDVQTISQLARLWDQQGLLLLHQEGIEERPDYALGSLCFGQPSRVYSRAIMRELRLPPALMWACFSAMGF